MLISASGFPSTRRRGTVLILFAVFLTALIGMVAFAIDVGYIALVKTKLQTTADAGALAGAGKMYILPGQPPVDEATVKAEVRQFVDLNVPGLTVLEEDIKLCRYNPFAAAGSRLSYDLSSAPANAVQVTVRRDALANSPLDLFFAPVIGNRQASVAATATAYIMKAGGIGAGSPLLPYAMNVNYFEASKGGQDYIGVDGLVIPTADAYTVDKTNFNVSLLPDGTREVVLFSSSASGPGNFGTVDIGGADNTTSGLVRQIYSGPDEADFADPAFAAQLNPQDGALYSPFVANGDTGMSTSAKSALTDIIGQPRIIPLYGPAPGPDGITGTIDDVDGPNGSDTVIDGVYGTGNTASYNIVKFAGVVITKVDFGGNPKRLWIQPAFVVSNKVTPAGGSGPVMDGVYTSPKLVIP
ncbi:MAG TPA: pilus assembly protein TadG-related protein [Fimbriiglobus sp.]|nr:pilus assembly protein TadG-related protein [Fimbriiglobus sp.]